MRDKNLVILEFQLDENIIREDRKFNPGTADTGVLSETYFCMPVRLKIGSVELLEIPVGSRVQKSSPWLSLPILDIATTGLEAVKEAKRRGASVYSLPGSGSRLYFRMIGDEVSAYSQVNGREARTHYNQLLQAFEDFASRVRHVLMEKVPDLENHSYWGKWLKRQVE